MVCWQKKNKSVLSLIVVSCYKDIFGVQHLCAGKEECLAFSYSSKILHKEEKLIHLIHSFIHSSDELLPLFLCKSLKRETNLQALKMAGLHQSDTAVSVQ